MENYYEVIERDKTLPINVMIHNVNEMGMHCHKELEFVLVLQGSVNIRVGKEMYILKEDGLILINSNEIHNAIKTHENNTLLVVQVDPEYYYPYDKNFSKMIFNCKSFLHKDEEQEPFDRIKGCLAELVWETAKKEKGYEFKIASILFSISANLINSFTYHVIEDEKILSINKNSYRLKSIMSYINENLNKNVTLQEIADKEKLNIYYLSHFFKKKTGMGFQEYLNVIRLDKALKLLVNSNYTITDIAYSSGYPSPKAFNKKFKEKYGCSPSNYRKNTIVSNGNNSDNYKFDIVEVNDNSSYLNVDRKTALQKIFKYLPSSESKKGPIKALNMINIDVNFGEEGTDLQPYWKKLITFSRASEGLRKQWQSQLKELQREVTFQYIRFHGIFSDDMMIFNLLEDGSINYNWTYVDELFDFFKEVNIKPVIDLGFMHSEINSTDRTMSWWKANVSPIKEMKLWVDMLEAFLRHCINRYGINEVESWYFEVWNDLELESTFWVGGREKYFSFYKKTADTIKGISKKLKVGGSAIAHEGIRYDAFLEEFLTYCMRNNSPLDFVSIHIYPEVCDNTRALDIEKLTNNKQNTDNILKRWKEIISTYYGENHTLDILSLTGEKTKTSLEYEPELYITQWNTPFYRGNCIHDTCYVAAFIVRNVLSSLGYTDALGYSTFTDIMEEHKEGVGPFYGGLGLINNNGLKKASYYAYYLLNMLGDEILYKGEDYIVTRKAEDIQILAYNYVDFDDLFVKSDISALTNKIPLKVYEAKEDKYFSFNINRIAGDYKITTYELNKDNGSVYDQWVSLGEPEELSREDIEYLKGRSYPKKTIDYLSISETYERKMQLPPNGIELIILEKRI